MFQSSSDDFRFRMHVYSVFFVFLIFIAVTPKPVHACASCSSGGEDPLVLYPGETNKWLLGISSAKFSEYADEQGRRTGVSGPDTRQTATAGVGHAFSRRVFAALSLPWIEQTRKDRTNSGWGDPSLNARYSLVLQNIADPFIPQLQLVAGYKKSYARNTYTYRDRDQLDLRGTGHDQWRLGLDLWWGMASVQLGFSHVFTFSEPQHVGGVGKIERGLERKTILSAGYPLFEQLLRLNLSLSRQESTKRRIQGTAIGNSETLSHNWSLGLDWRISEWLLTKVYWADTLKEMEQKNTTMGRSVGVSLLGTW